MTGLLLGQLKKLSKSSSNKYERKDLGELDRIRNMEVTRTVNGGLFLSHSMYVKDVLKVSKDCLPTNGSKLISGETPMDKKIRLHKSGFTQLRFQHKEIEIEKGATKCDAGIPYREVVGSCALACRWI